MSNTKGSDLVPYSRWLKYILVELSNLQRELIYYFLTISKQYNNSIYHGVRSILAYIINNVQAFDIIPWIKYYFKYTSLDRKRYFY